MDVKHKQCKLRKACSSGSTPCPTGKGDAEGYAALRLHSEVIFEQTPPFFRPNY